MMMSMIQEQNASFNKLIMHQQQAMQAQAAQQQQQSTALLTALVSAMSPIARMPLMTAPLPPPPPPMTVSPLHEPVRTVKPREASASQFMVKEKRSSASSRSQTELLPTSSRLGAKQPVKLEVFDWLEEATILSSDSDDDSDHDSEADNGADSESQF